LAELFDNQSECIDFAEYSKRATAKLSYEDNIAEVNIVFISFDIYKALLNILLRQNFSY